ncbi:unnamed protein product [Cylicocyclus nassatus]|uniref:Uncharacterized protein n=2 Tax=Cylicocyclus nassatus TaxID=53992 RepID=A0AA36GMX0_CYLNA|nr:unnamed protein product [Cylicocyclus nassatus]
MTPNTKNQDNLWSWDLSPDFIYLEERHSMRLDRLMESTLDRTKTITRTNEDEADPDYSCLRFVHVSSFIPIFMLIPIISPSSKCFIPVIELSI